MDKVTIVNCSKHNKSTCEQYQGYHNWETWAVGLWLNNDITEYTQLHQFLADSDDNDDVSCWLKSYVVNKFNDKDGYGDIQEFNQLLKVDWLELVETERND